MKKLLCLIVFVLPAVFMISCGSTCPACPAQETVFTAKFQNGVWPNAAFAGIADVSLFESTPDNGPDAAVLCTVRPDSGNRARTLFHFDLRGYLPANVTVTKAYLTLNGTSEAITLESHVLTVQNYIPDATWNTSGYASWTGGTYQSAASGSSQLDADNNVFTVEISAATAQESLYNPNNNNGIILTAAGEGTSTGTLNINSCDYSIEMYRPMLTVYYTMN